MDERLRWRSVDSCWVDEETRVWFGGEELPESARMRRGWVVSTGDVWWARWEVAQADQWQLRAPYLYSTKRVRPEEVTSGDLSASLEGLEEAEQDRWWGLGG